MMSETNTFEFDVPIHADGGTGRVHVLLPCDASQIEQFVKKTYGLEENLRDSWKGICVFSPELDAKVGRPTVVIALRSWETGADNYAVLAHECFHAAEWMLKQTGYQPPADWLEFPVEGGPRAAWEDAAYLLQWIMKRVLEKILESS
jgi:hypothetical protein